MAKMTLAEAALDLIRDDGGGFSFAVFPLEPGKKTPLGALAPRGFKNATRDADIVRAWWTREPNANIGIWCDHVVVLDVDGAIGEASLAALEAVRGAMPRTLQVNTPRGRHLYWLAPKGEPIANSAGKVGPGLDVRGPGGYVVAPPSVVDGKEYTWDGECYHLPYALSALTGRPS